MIRFPEAARRADRPASGWFQRQAETWKTERARAEAVRQRKHEFAEVSDETLHDLGLTREEVTGGSLWRSDLPFFMQAGFRAGRNG